MTERRQILRPGKYFYVFDIVMQYIHRIYFSIVIAENINLVRYARTRFIFLFIFRRIYLIFLVIFIPNFHDTRMVFWCLLSLFFFTCSEIKLKNKMSTFQISSTNCGGIRDYELIQTCLEPFHGGEIGQLGNTFYGYIRHEMEKFSKPILVLRSYGCSKYMKRHNCGLYKYKGCDENSRTKR